MPLALKKSSRGCCSSLCLVLKKYKDTMIDQNHLPVNVAELVLAETTLQANSDIERPASRHGTSNTRHRDHGNVLQLDIRGGFGDEDETLVQEIKQTLVGLDGALNSVVTVVAGEVLGRHDNLLAGQAAENLGHHLVNRLFVVWLQLILVLGLQEVPKAGLVD
jgi:hypothetical protein